MSSTDNHKTTKPLVNFDWLRFTLFLFFLGYTYIVARGLMPLPDEPPRIKFLETLCVTGGIVIAFWALVSRFRIFIPCVLVFLIWPARHQLNERIEFLQTMIQPYQAENILRWALIGAGILLLLPKSFKLYKKSLKEAGTKRSRLFQAGFPF